jgi:NADPH:quinone reductase-like Zn-dependent oxidoreductase
MPSAFDNKAAWITDAKVRPLKVGPGPNPNPSETEVVIKVSYAAVNPTDWKVRKIY